MMFMSLSDVLSILEQYKYLLIFPIVILEGPIIMIVSGFFVYLGFLNIYVTFLLLVVGDLTGDALHYVVGRYWQKSPWIKRNGYLFGYNEKSEEYIGNHFRNHSIKTVIFAKFAHGVGTAIQIAAGIARIDFSKYLFINFLGTVLKTLILMSIGYYVGGSYVKIDGYLNTFALIMISIFLFLFLYYLSHKYIKNYLMRSE